VTNLNFQIDSIGSSTATTLVGRFGSALGSFEGEGRCEELGGLEDTLEHSEGFGGGDSGGLVDANEAFERAGSGGDAGEIGSGHVSAEFTRWLRGVVRN
jgi:hypothetical protein